MVTVLMRGEVYPQGVRRTEVPFDPLTIAVMLLAVLILGLSKGGFAGIGMVSLPLLSLVIPPTTAAGIMLPVLMFQDAISVYAYRRTFDRYNLRLMLPAAVLGIAAGTLMISSVDRGMFEIVLGSVSVLFGVERLLRYFGKPPKPHKPNLVIGLICGTLAGFTSMVAHAGVPPFQFFVLPQRLPRDVFIGTSVFFYAVVNLIKLPFFLSLGQVTATTAVVSLTLTPVAFLSVLLGIWLVRRISSDCYIIVANAILIGVGVLLIWRGVSL
jgi:uncharacterized membrane protein YfcA